MSTYAEHPVTTSTPDWHDKFQSERKKARILGATTVASALLAVGVGAWGLNAQGASVSSGPGGGAGQFGPPGSSTGQFAPPGTSNSGAQDLAGTLLNSDGSVNTDAVEQLVAQAPDGMLDQILSMAVQNGELTQAQADEIAAAASGTDSSSTDSTSAQDI